MEAKKVKKEIPSKAYYGIETSRALENFKVSGIHFQKELIYTIAKIKKAAAFAHLEAKELDPKKASAIIKACTDYDDGYNNTA